MGLCWVVLFVVVCVGVVLLSCVVLCGVGCCCCVLFGFVVM